VEFDTGSPPSAPRRSALRSPPRRTIIIMNHHRRRVTPASARGARPLHGVEAPRHEAVLIDRGPRPVRWRDDAQGPDERRRDAANRGRTLDIRSERRPRAPTPLRWRIDGLSRGAAGPLRQQILGAA
jgi:hypothetical protein